MGSWRSRLRILTVVGVAALGACARSDEELREIARIPRLAVPASVPAHEFDALAGPVRIRADQVLAVTRLGARIEIPTSEIIYLGFDPAYQRPGVYPVGSVRVLRPRLTIPIDTVVTGLNLFLDLFEPRVTVESFVVEDATLGELAHPSLGVGRWLWRFQDVDLRARDLRLGGPAHGPEGLRLEVSGVGEIKGEPVLLRSVAVRADRTTRVFTFDAGVALRTSRVQAAGTVTRNGPWQVTLAGDTLLYREIRMLPLPDAVPRAGSGSALVRFRGAGGHASVLVDRLVARRGASLLSARGAVVGGVDPLVRGAVLRLESLTSENFEAMYGAGLPFSGTLTGELRAEGSLVRGLAVAGELAQRPPQGSTPEESRIALEGTVVVQPDLRFDLQLTGDPIRAVDTVFTAALRARGTPDSLSIAGDVGMPGAQPVFAAVDARVQRAPGAAPRLTGHALLRYTPREEGALAARAAANGAASNDAADGSLPSADVTRGEPLTARAEGSVVLADNGALDLRVAADSLPLAALPLPGELANLRGDLDAELRIHGTLDRAHVTIGRLHGRAGEGTFDIGGTVELAGKESRFDLTLVADSVNAYEADDADMVVSAELRARGTLSAARVEGTADLVGGWAKEDLFRPVSPLDPSSPPYLELAQRVPWPDDSRLRRAARARQGEAPGIEADVVVQAHPGFKVIDEDSELFGAGRVRMHVSRDGLRADGVYDVHGGFYMSFGERFRVTGGAVRFTGEDFEPRVAVIADHENNNRLGAGLGAPLAPLERVHEFEFSGTGRASRTSEELRRPAMLPETQLEMAASLIYGVEPQPVTGWRDRPFWRPDEGERIGERAESQGAALLWSYTADEGYDYLPLSRGYLQAGTIVAGSRYPGRTVVGPMLRGAAVLGRGFEVMVSQPLDGDRLPGVRARLRRGLSWFELFHEPRFHATAAMGAGAPGFGQRRSTGAGVRFLWEF